MASHKAVRFIFLLLTVALTQQSPIITADVADADLNEADYRLKSALKPENYRIELNLPENFHSVKKFTGVVDITFEKTTAALTQTTITLNARDITISDKSKPTLKEDGKDDILDANKPCEPNEKLERIVCKLANGKTIAKDKVYTLRIEYSAKLHEDMYGFYLSSYKLQNGETEYLATTQFQPTHARRAFPCFDEPNYKATFDIKITHPVGYTALSNGEINNIEEDGTSVTATFKTTPKMSTYICAFIVSKFRGLYQFTNQVKLNRVWARSDLLQHGSYSQDIAPKIVQSLNAYTGINYVRKDMEKLDQVAIPDFSAGAMENWGLITYRESALLWDEYESPLKTKQRVAAVIAHELAHFWFGNLVTCDWWSVTWLNEGFARYFQYFTTAEVEKDWEMEKQFTIEQQRSIFISDSLENSVPLTSEDKDVLTPQQSSSKFSSISYNKGASIIRMARNFLGETVFREGLEKYLDKNQGENTKPSDLWIAFTPKPGTLPTDDTKLEAVMASWTDEAGYPVITVNKIKDSKNVELTQKRFYSHKVEEESRADTTWFIPVTYTNKKYLESESETEPKVKNDWLLPSETKLVINNALDGSDWILLNVEDSGYYRVNYDDELWEALKDALSSETNKIDSQSQAVLVDDALNLARAGLLPYGKALDFISFLENETDYYTWYSALNAISYIRQRLDPAKDVYYLVKAHTRALMAKLLEVSDFEIADDATQIDIYRNNLALTWSCELDTKDCIKKSEELLQELITDGTPVHPDLRSVVYCYGVRDTQDTKPWEFLYDRLSKTQLPSEIATIIPALGCTKNKELLERYLDESINPNSIIRQQDAQSVYTAVITGNPEGVSVAFGFLEEKFPEIKNYYGGLNALSSVISATGDRLRTQEQINDFERFIKEKEAELGEAFQTGKQAVEKATQNLKWVSTYEGELESYLKEAVPTTVPPPTTKQPTMVSSSVDTTTDQPQSTTPSGASTVTVCSTVLVLSILKVLF